MPIAFAKSEDDVARYIAKAIRAKVTPGADEYSFTIRRSSGERTTKLQKSKLTAILADLAARELHEETALITDTSFEVLVNEESPSYTRRMRDDVIRVSDPETKLTYVVSSASDAYLILLISIAAEKDALRDLGFAIFPSSYIDRILVEQQADALELLRALSGRMLTLKIGSDVKMPVRRFQIATTSFLFHLAFNLDIALVPQRFLLEVSRRGRIGHMRRSTAEDLDPPRRTYNEDLVNHYVLAVSTDNSTVQFLSYYHVLEHFFEAVFNDDLVEQIKTALTHPGFSYKRKKDVGQLIKTIKQSLQIRSETISFSEPEALRLVVTRYVDMNELLASLEQFEPSLVAYYQTTEAPFSRGVRVDLRSTDREGALKNLARRIYSTRNALVHN